MKKGAHGFSLLEMLITSAIIGGVVAAVVRFSPIITTFVRRFQSQQTAQTEGTSSMDTMVRTLRLGKASTVEICSCNQDECSLPACNPTTANVPPNSHIDFFTQDNNYHAFYWENGDLKHWNRDTNGNSVISTMAHNVSNVTFSGNPLDLSVITITLEMDVTRDAGNTATIKKMTLPTQSVRLISTQ